MTALPEKFKARMKQQLGSEYEAFIASYCEPPVRGIRVNTLKVSVEKLRELIPWRTEPSPTLAEGLILAEEAEHIGSEPYHIAGLYYMQEPSAMSVIEAAMIEPGMKVLDLCAAPGGKSGGILSRLMGKGLLVSNEIVPNRARELAGNLERLGAVNAAVTCAHPDAVAGALPRFFDRVVVDAPCSGEGMFRKDPTAVAEWSEEHVLSCAARQKAILESAAKCVAPGGRLIYSTCTFSIDENEGVIEAFLKRHSEFELEMTRRLYPHTVRGEGHFAARLILTGESVGAADEKPNDGKQKRRPTDGAGFCPLARDREARAALDEFFGSVLSCPAPEPSMLFLCGKQNPRLLYCPFDIPEGLKKLPVLMPGLEIGTLTSGFKKTLLRPSHSFFMAAHGFPYRRSIDLEPKSGELRAFLAGETIGCSIPLSEGQYLPVTVSGYPVGFGKCVDGVLKNHLPKGLKVTIR